MELRDYQVEFCEAVEKAFSKHQTVLGVMATGLGKTICFVELMQRHPGRCLVIAPQIDLVDQAAAKIAAVTGEAPGIERAEFRSNETEFGRSRFVVGSKQTLCGRGNRFERLRDISLVVYDEAHTAATKQTKRILDHYRNAGALMLGVTATPNRNDGKSLAELFGHCAYEYGILDAIEDGWLVRPEAKCCRVASLDLSEVRTKGKNGDFREGDLAKAMEDDRVCLEIAAITAAEIGDDRTVVFCASVEEASAVAQTLRCQYGIRADYVCSDQKRLSAGDRAQRMRAFRKGDLQVLTNVGIVTTGVDIPEISHIVMARPTRSVALYTQCIGRATRPLPGVVDFASSDAAMRRAAIANSAKPVFRITDLVDNSRRHSLVQAHDALAGRAIGDLDAAALEAAANKGTRRDVVKTTAEILESRRKEEERRREFEVRRERLLRSIDVSATYDTELVNMFIEERAEKIRSQRVQRMPFGKFKYQPITKVPTSYLAWVHRTNQDRKMNKFTEEVAKELIMRKQNVRPQQEPAGVPVGLSDAGLNF